MSRFKYDIDIPEAVLPELQKYVEPLDFLIPNWCSQVFIGWQDVNRSDPDTSINCSVYYDYRWARITFYASWLQVREENKREQVMHDIIHICLHPICGYVRSILKILVDEKEAAKFNASILEQVRERTEAVTEDLATIIDNVTKP